MRPSVGWTCHPAVCLPDALGFACAPTRTNKGGGSVRLPLGGAYRWHQDQLTNIACGFVSLRQLAPVPLQHELDGLGDCGREGFGQPLRCQQIPWPNLRIRIIAKPTMHRPSNGRVGGSGTWSLTEKKVAE